MSYIKSQLADVERGCGKLICPSCQEIEPDEEDNGHKFDCEYEGEGLNQCGKNKFLCSICQAKRQTLLMCQAEREKEHKELRDSINLIFINNQKNDRGIMKKALVRKIHEEITALLEGDGE